MQLWYASTQPIYRPVYRLVSYRSGTRVRGGQGARCTPRPPPPPPPLSAAAHGGSHALRSAPHPQPPAGGRAAPSASGCVGSRWAPPIPPGIAEARPRTVVLPGPAAASRRQALVDVALLVGLGPAAARAAPPPAPDRARIRLQTNVVPALSGVAFTACLCARLHAQCTGGWGQVTVSLNMAVEQYVQRVRRAWPMAEQQLTALSEAGQYSELALSLVLSPFEDVKQSLFYLPFALLEEGSPEATDSLDLYRDFLRQVKVLDRTANEAARFAAEDEEVNAALGAVRASVQHFMEAMS